jgi:hypothetical protein
VHPGYNKILIPKDCPQPLLVEDPERRNNTDDPANAILEATVESLDTMVLNFHLYSKVSNLKTYYIDPYKKKSQQQLLHSRIEKNYKTFYSELENYDLYILLCYFKCVYIGASLIFIDNKHMKDRVPRGNGTLCRVLGVKLKENAPSHRVKNNYRKKVWTVNTKHVEWIQCEHVNIPRHIVQLETQIYELKKGQQNNENKTKLERLKEMLSKEKKNRIFNLVPEQFSPEVNVKHHHTSTRKQKLRCKMNQIPANSNDATTGHKLQGMKKI